MFPIIPRAKQPDYSTGLDSRSLACQRGPNSQLHLPLTKQSVLVAQMRNFYVGNNVGLRGLHLYYQHTQPDFVIAGQDDVYPGV